MGMTEKDAVVSLFTYLVMCNEKAGNYGSENHITPNLFSEFYYENAVTECMMKLMVDPETIVKLACKTMNSKFDENFRRYLFAELVRFSHCASEIIQNALKNIYAHMELHDRTYEELLADLCGEEVHELE